MYICNRAEDRLICRECIHSRPHDRIVDDLHPDSCGTRGRKCIDTEINFIRVKCIEIENKNNSGQGDLRSL